MKLFSNRKRPVHLGPFPLEHLRRQPQATPVRLNPASPANPRATSGFGRVVEEYLDAYLSSDSIPVASISPNPVICDDSGCSGAWGHSPAAYNAILAEMSAISSELVNDPAVTIGVTYEHIGMGFCGNPFGTDIWPLTTVTITGRQFDFATPLINPVFGALTLECSASLTGEDFETCPDGVAVPPCS